MKKRDALRRYVAVLRKPNVEAWYEGHLRGKSQATIVEDLQRAVEQDELTVEEALVLALIVGHQWTVKFEGVP